MNIVKSVPVILLLTIISCTEDKNPVVPPAQAAETVKINEVHSRGNAVTPDWIELYNTGTAEADISGYKIFGEESVTGSKAKKVLAPGTVIPAGRYLVITIDDSSASGFNLSVEGGKVWFENSKGAIADSVTFPALATNYSYGRQPDGSDTWEAGIASRGVSNGSTTLENPVVMNEIYSRGTVGAPDWVEIYNLTSTPVDISGYMIYDIGGYTGNRPKKELPAGTIVPANGYYVISTEGSGDASDFGLSSAGENLWLENPSGAVVDSVLFAAMIETQTYGRLPDGSANWQILTTITKGTANSNVLPVSVVMNEIYSRGTTIEPDWIEIYNKLSTPGDISGYKIYDNGGEQAAKPKKVIPDGTIVPANGFIVITTEGSGDPSDFGLSSAGEKVWLENSNGGIADSVTFPAMAELQSYGRSPDGGTTWQLSGRITKGLSNLSNPKVPVTLSITGQLPAELRESSGLAITAAGKLWSHNDANNSNVLHCVNPAGQLLRTLTITNVNNIDWEDLATDNQKRIYINDAGNNTNSRTDLAIYRIPDPETITGNEVAAEIINFTLEDQNAFPPPASNANYDIESIAWKQDTIFLFTKDRSSPFTGISKMYKLPAVPGTHVAKLAGSYFLGNNVNAAWLTAADIDHAAGALVLLVKERLIVFRNYPGNNFFAGEIIEYVFNTLPGQVEAVAFSGSSKIYITEEGSASVPGNIYEVSIPSK
ncbi:MAG: lamin tail domain-containing protein [Ignavibacteriaceae bacterium]|nr:lamin tail domain-containing protein [Ignavibacteriaceae bacterium]